MVIPVSPRISYIEFHDARLAELRIRPRGCVGLVLSSLNVYEEQGHERFDIWVYRGSLAIEGVRAVDFSGKWDQGSVVMGLSLDNREPGADVLNLLEGCQMRHMELSIFGGAKIGISGTSVKLNLDQRLTFLETWIGPLVGAPSGALAAGGTAQWHANVPRPTPADASFRLNSQTVNSQAVALGYDDFNAQLVSLSFAVVRRDSEAARRDSTPSRTPWQTSAAQHARSASTAGIRMPCRWPSERTLDECESSSRFP